MGAADEVVRAVESVSATSFILAASSGMGSLRRRLMRGAVDSGGVGAAGVWARTTPGSPGAGMWAMAPSSRPRRRMLMVAVRSVWPMRSGMATCWAPRLSVTRTTHSRRTVAPGAGDWARMWPGGDVGGVEAVLDVEAEAEGAGFLLASARERPARLGTLTSRPWMARRMAMKAERSATASMARAPRTMLKKRLMREIFIC